jgi:acyl dehydratase
MTRTVQFSELASLPGTDLGASDWVEITQEMINTFADVTNDHQWIHVDVERATKEIGGTIAHGFLTVSLMSGMSYGLLKIEGVTRAINYGFDKLRFTDVVRPGERIRLRQKILKVEEKAGGVAMTRECTVEIEGKDRPALVAEWVGVVYGG